MNRALTAFWLCAIFFVMFFPSAVCAQSMQGTDSTAPSAVTGINSIRITAISPSPDANLKRGSKTSFSVTVEYNLVSDDKATVSVVLQDQSDMSLGAEMDVVKRGVGKITLKKEIIVPPNAKAISIFTPLMVEGARQTMEADHRVYKVE